MTIGLDGEHPRASTDGAVEIPDPAWIAMQRVAASRETSSYQMGIPASCNPARTAEGCGTVRDLALQAAANVPARSSRPERLKTHRVVGKGASVATLRGKPRYAFPITTGEWVGAINPRSQGAPSHRYGLH